MHAPCSLIERFPTGEDCHDMIQINTLMDAAEMDRFGRAWLIE
jgi:hypothetical protein